MVKELNETEGINTYEKRVKRVKTIIKNWNEIVRHFKGSSPS
jgi:hypothetical protein